MKKIFLVIVVLIVIFAISCSASSKCDEGTLEATSNTEMPTQQAVQNLNTQNQQQGIGNSDLDTMVKSFAFPTKSADNLNYDETCPGLPIDLINQLKKSVYHGNSDSLINELNDKSLMISAKDFNFKPNQSDDIDLEEKELNDAIIDGATNYFIYKCDINGDGTDEIIMIQNLKYDYSDSNCAYLLKKVNDKYVYAGDDYLGYYRCCAILKKDNKFYLIANFDDYDTKTTKAVGLYTLDGDNNGFMWLLNKHHKYIRKTSDGYQYNLLYNNTNHPLVRDIQTYINDIGTDLIYADRAHNTFYGNESARSDLQKEATNNNLELWNVNSIDVNNDGKDEFFDREILYDGGSDRGETKVYWYNPKKKAAYPAPYKVWSPTNYFLTQQWFKIINRKTVIFSLYHKNAEDTYLLDARINENGQTTILQDYMITMETNIELSDDWEYNDTNSVQINYHDPEVEKAFPADLDKRTNRLAKKVQGGFTAVNYKDKDIPNGLITLAEKALFHDKIDQLNIGTASFQISKDHFYDKYGKYTYYETKKDFNCYLINIYKYQLSKNTYYIMVADSGGTDESVDITIYKESNGKLTVLDSWPSLDLNARVIKYKNALYFIESSYNYYSKYTDTVYIYKLSSRKIKKYVTIELTLKQYEWEEIFNNHKSYEKSISSYVDSIKNDLIKNSPMYDNIQVYLGDENKDFNEDKQQRLKSVGGANDYYEIDFNNDGDPEYFEKHFWFPSNYTTLYLINNFYKFTDKRVISINGCFEKEDMALIQLWFKEFEGKVFTFRLFLYNQNKYFLNVSLVEDTNITQVQSYIIVPKNRFDIRTQNRKASEK